MYVSEGAASLGGGQRPGAFESAAINYLEIKELNELVVEYRARIRGLVEGYRAYRGAAVSDWAVSRKVYVSYETLYMRRQLADLWRLYRVIVADCHEMTALYFQQRGFKYAQAS